MINKATSLLSNLSNIFENSISDGKKIGLFLGVYIILKIWFYNVCFIPSPDEYGYVLSSRWFEDALREGSSLGSVFSAHGVYQLFIGVLYYIIGNDDLLLPNIVAQIFTFGTAFLLYKILKNYSESVLLAFLGVGIFLTLPDIFVNGHRYWLDVPAMFLCTALMYLLINKRSSWLVALVLLLILMAKEYVFFLAALSTIVCVLVGSKSVGVKKSMIGLVIIFTPILLYLYIVLFKEWLPTNSVLDSIFNDFFIDIDGSTIKDGNRAASRFNWTSQSFSERLWFKFYDYAFDESIILMSLFGFAYWIYNRVRSMLYDYAPDNIKGDVVLSVFFIVGFGFYMTSYIKHMRVFYPFLVPMIYFIVYPFWAMIYKEKNIVARNVILLVISASLVASFCQGGLRNLEIGVLSILAIITFFNLVYHNNRPKKLALSSLFALILISVNFMWYNELGKNMWSGIKAIDKPFYSDLTPEFRNQLSTLVFSGDRITFDFIFHHYEFLYFVNARKTQNDRHYSKVTLRPNNFEYDDYPANALPSRKFKLENLTNESLDTCRNVFYDSDYFISRNILTMDGISLIARSDNDQIKVYKLSEELQQLPLKD